MKIMAINEMNNDDRNKRLSSSSGRGADGERLQAAARGLEAGADAAA